MQLTQPSRPPPPAGGGDDAPAPGEFAAPRPPLPRWAGERPAAAARVWLLPAGLFLVLASLTVALWWSERSLWRHLWQSQPLQRAALETRAADWVLGGGLALSLLVSTAVLQVLRHRAHEQAQARHHLDALESLHAISTAISAGLAAGPGALGRLCEEARQLLRMDRAGILRLDRGGAGTLKLLAWAGRTPPDPPRSYALDDLPACRQCLATGEVLLARDVGAAAFPVNPRMLALFEVGSMILIPLSVERERIGLMTFSNSRRTAFTDADRRLARLLGAQAAVILANGQLYAQMCGALEAQEHLIEQRENLAAVNAAIYQAQTLDQSLQKIAQLAPNALGADVCAVTLTDDRDPAGGLVIAAATEPYDRHAGRRVPAAPTPDAERLFRAGDAYAVADAAAEGLELHELWGLIPGVGSLLCVPLFRSDRRPLGVLNLVRFRRGAFTSGQISLAQIFAARAAAAIEQARLHEETRLALDVQRRLTEQHDRLWAVTTEIYQAGTLQESLDRVVERAPAALGVDVCVINLTTDRPGVVVLAAATGSAGGELVGRPIDVNGKNAGRVLETGQVVAVEDARSDGGIAPGYRERFNIGSIVYVPLLRNDGRPMGLLLLLRHEPGPFGLEQLGLAKVFATRAATAIENAQLLEQARRDADDKAMLLRELNHRVKNNLAGIVGLLTVAPPDMPPAGRAWLDRVTDRIRLMAGAHQLFAGGGWQAVSLDRLVDQVLSSLSVVRMPGVEVRLDLDPPDLPVPSHRALGLAMVLHELGHNAIVHGLGARGGRGTLTIRSRLIRTGAAAAGGDELYVEVADGGAGREDGEPRPAEAANPAGGAGRTGMGMELVRGLVARELRGHVAVRMGETGGGTGGGGGGGTVAAVTFPLTDRPRARRQGDSNGASSAERPAATVVAG